VQRDPPPLTEYYRHRAVRMRIREYCGLESGTAPSCIFLAAELPDQPRPIGWSLDPMFPVERFDDLLNRGADVFRSLWDRTSLPVCLDIDYLNAELAGHAFAKPREAFMRIEPTYAAVATLLREYGIEMMGLMTGRGYQFTGRIPLGSPLVQDLATLAFGEPEWYHTQSVRLPRWEIDRVAPWHARAFIGLGLVLEYFAHRVIRRAAASSPIPLVVNGTHVGRGPNGREAVSFDLSFAGDPLDVRHMRTAFGGYQQHRFRPDVYGPEIAALDPLITVPRGSMSLDDMLRGARHPQGAVRLAESGSAGIPVVTTGMSALAADYRASPLARFHQTFYAIEPHGPAAWPDTYDRFDLAHLPPCIAAALAMPNDLLLKPEHLQHVTRYLLSEGWAPRHIAGLVWSRYEKPYEWGDRWNHLSARERADFDVRVFAGMVLTGLDEGIDFNCRSAQEKRLCPGPGCAHDLRVMRDRLLARVAQ
jgi:hypothetical protein